MPMYIIEKKESKIVVSPWPVIKFLIFSNSSTLEPNSPTALLSKNSNGNRYK